MDGVIIAKYQAVKKRFNNVGLDLRVINKKYLTCRILDTYQDVTEFQTVDEAIKYVEGYEYAASVINPQIKINKDMEVAIHAVSENIQSLMEVLDVSPQYSQASRPETGLLNNSRLILEPFTE